MFKELVVRRQSWGRESSLLVVCIEPSGDLVLRLTEGGPLADEMLGGDQEYWETVPAAFKDAVMVHLLKERFGRKREFKRWLQAPGAVKDTILLCLVKYRFTSVDDFGRWLYERGIPHESHSYP
jgi:hypothetical protein